MDLDDAVHGLAECLREMVGVANKVRDLLVIEGTDDVIKEIGLVSLEVALLIHKYTQVSFLGQSLLLYHRTPPLNLRL